ncbi:MAG: hypothetical protein KIT39_02840 [Nitrospirales bacterium]|nr:hypothetical protein [Nitrospirales bacterium]
MWHQDLCGQTTYSHSRCIAKPFSFKRHHQLSVWLAPALSPAPQNWCKNSGTHFLQQKHLLPFDENKASE